MEPTDRSGVARDPAQTFDDVCCAIANGIRELARTVVPVHAGAELIASRQIRFACRADLVPRNPQVKWRPLKPGDRLADLEAELCVERKGAVVPRDLQQAYAREMPLGSSIHHCPHELTSYRAVHDRWIDGHRANAGDGRALIEEVAAHRPAIQFGHDRIEAGMR